MSKMIMVDYLSECDENGKPIGHRIKAGNEYIEFLKDRFELCLYADAQVLEFFEAEEKQPLKFPVGRNVSGKSKKLAYLKNIKDIFKRNDEGLVWFFAPDIYACIAILLFPRGKKRIAMNICDEYAYKPVKNFILRQSLKKTDLVFATNKHLADNIPGSVLVPDYTYKKEVYSAYSKADRQERVVCLGTMNEKKKLTEAVEAFNKNGYPLYIAGQFASKEKYQQLCRIKADNVTIEDRFIDEKEYYELLGSSKFSLLPYDEEFYRNRTSGVLQESMFVDTVPIAHKSILEFNGIEGIGYSSLSELESMNFTEADTSVHIKGYSKDREDFYSCDAVKNRVAEELKKLQQK